MKNGQISTDPILPSCPSGMLQRHSKHHCIKNRINWWSGWVRVERTPVGIDEPPSRNFCFHSGSTIRSFFVTILSQNIFPFITRPWFQIRGEFQSFLRFPARLWPGTNRATFSTKMQSIANGTTFYKLSTNFHPGIGVKRSVMAVRSCTMWVGILYITPSGT